MPRLLRRKEQTVDQDDRKDGEVAEVIAEARSLVAVLERGVAKLDEVLPEPTERSNGQA